MPLPPRARAVRGDADDLAGAAGEVDQALVADDDLHGIDPALVAVGVFALGVEWHQVGMAQHRVRFEAHLGALADGADQTCHIALGQRRGGRADSAGGRRALRCRPASEVPAPWVCALIVMGTL